MKKTLLCSVFMVPLALSCAEKPGTDIPDTVIGHCVYENQFSGKEECREFRGSQWTSDAAQTSCDEYEVALVDGACEYQDVLGTCINPGGEEEKVIVLIQPGVDANDCASTKRGCELFGGGTFVDGPVCGDASIDPDDVYDAENYSVPPYQQCVDPIDGEPGENNGQVCTWTQVGGCTEVGRNFEDYGSCEDVISQRGYYPVPPNESEAVDDPRMQDPEYVAELAWVTEQANACACVCCHKGSVTPNGAAIWDTEGAGQENWINNFTPYGLAFGAGWVDSDPLGAYQAEENNGFSRAISGLPSTDEPRMAAFFVNELNHRGIPESDFADLGPQPAVFATQINFEPEACEEGQGVDADGTVRWTGGRARYVYVLDADAANPLSPPNLNLPEGTLWQIGTVPPAVPPRTGEITYGSTPEGTIMNVPSVGEAPALVEGETYYLYTQADVMQPITRCLFTFGD